jgi:hypothetical protein
MAKTNAERQRDYRERNKNNPLFRTEEARRAKKYRKDPKYVESQRKNVYNRQVRFQMKRKQQEIPEVTPYSQKSSENRAFQR